MDGQKTDVKKIMALKAAGWSLERIAHEMRMSPDDVENEISKYTKKEKVRERDRHEENGRQEEKGILLVTLSTEQLREIYEKAAAIGAEEALKAFKQEREKEYKGRADRRLRNTKLLLRNYHMLKDHAEESVFGRTQMEESALDILESMMSLYDSEVIIESIKRSATRTAVIVSHIETMFSLYATYCDKSRNRDIDMRRYETLWNMYIAEDTMSPKEIAQKQNVSKDTVYSDLRMATEKLSALIFGVDGLNVR